MSRSHSLLSAAAGLATGRTTHAPPAGARPQTTVAVTVPGWYGWVASVGDSTGTGGTGAHAVPRAESRQTAAPGESPVEAGQPKPRG